MGAPPRPERGEAGVGAATDRGPVTLQVEGLQAPGQNVPRRRAPEPWDHPKGPAVGGSQVRCGCRGGRAGGAQPGGENPEPRQADFQAPGRTGGMGPPF